MKRYLVLLVLVVASPFVSMLFVDYLVAWNIAKNAEYFTLTFQESILYTCLAMISYFLIVLTIYVIDLRNFRRLQLKKSEN